MSADEVHFEVFIRRTVMSGWTLDSLNEDRDDALASARTALASRRAVAARVIKETLDVARGAYTSATILAEGDTKVRARARVEEAEEEEEDAPVCVTPADLYSAAAREKIGRLLKGWLRQKRVTPFELLHSPALAERLDASGLELQGAIQKVSIPESKARGMSVHAVIRRYQRLIEAAIERLAADGRRDAFPDLTAYGFTRATKAALRTADPAYVLGGAVTAALASASGWKVKIESLLDLADAAGPAGPVRDLQFKVLEAMMAEILGAPAALAELFDSPREPGDELMALARLVAPDPNPGASGASDSDSPLVRRLSRWLEEPAFSAVRAVVGRRFLAELGASRRLHPDDPEAEIAKIRALAQGLAHAAPAMPPEGVQAAFMGRCATLVTADFVQAFIAQVADSALTEVQALMRLGENVVGPANKRAVARWLKGAVGGVRFERELRTGPDTPTLKLAHLAELQHHLLHVGLADADREEIADKIGEVGGLIETNAKLMSHIGRAPAAPLHRMMLLLKFASGETAPLGPAAASARAEVARLARLPELRSALTDAPEMMTRIKALMAAAGLAA